MRPTAAALLCVLLAATQVRAQTPDAEGRARAAYDRGTAAFDAGRWDVAALEFTRADDLAPNPVALESALKAAVLADDAVLAMALADRADARQASGSLASEAARARERFAARVGSLLVRCPDARPCVARVDGAVHPIDQARWVRAGDRGVEIDVEGATTRHTVRVDGGARVDWRAPPSRPPVTIAPPPAAAPAASPPPMTAAPRAPERATRSKPLSTTPFWIGAGVTAIFGGLAAWQGIEALSYNQAYLDDGDDSAEEPGRAAQLRANILLGAAALAGAGTVVMAVVFVDWSGSSAAPKTARMSPVLQVCGSF